MLHGINLIHNSISAALEKKTCQYLKNLDQVLVTASRFPTVCAAVPSSFSLAQKLLSSETMQTVKQLGGHGDEELEENQNKVVRKNWVSRLVDTTMQT